MDSIVGIMMVLGAIGGIALSKSCDEALEAKVKVMHQVCDSVCGQHPVLYYDDKECTCNHSITVKKVNK